jgi:hypothetical protein
VATKSVSAVAKGAEARARYSGNNWEQAEFIRRELTPTESEACKNWDLSEEGAFSGLMCLSDQNYKVTFRWDEYNHCYGCWLLPAKDDDTNSGLILTGRGSSSYKAFKQAFFKHVVLFSEAWPRGGDERGSGEIDD